MKPVMNGVMAAVVAVISPGTGASVELAWPGWDGAQSRDGSGCSVRPASMKLRK